MANTNMTDDTKAAGNFNASIDQAIQAVARAVLSQEARDELKRIDRAVEGELNPDKRAVAAKRFARVLTAELDVADGKHDRMITRDTLLRKLDKAFQALPHELAEGFPMETFRKSLEAMPPRISVDKVNELADKRIQEAVAAIKAGKAPGNSTFDAITIPGMVPTTPAVPAKSIANSPA